VDPPGTILVVDDLEANRFLLREILETAGHRVLLASDGPEAIERAAAERPDAVLLDVRMPGMDGFEVCRTLRAMAETAHLPIVLITANAAGDDELVAGLEAGAHDFLVKPIQRAVLLARVGVMVRIRRTEETVRRLSMVDEFTGLFSKKYVLHRLDEELERGRRRRSPLVVAMIDLDDFKQCNDRFGHPFGDEVLKRVSAVLKANVRAYDSVGRYGGEEFLVLQPELSEEEAVSAVERLRDRVRAERFASRGESWSVGFSAGVAAWDHEADAAEMVHRADAALYAAKRAGKGNVSRWSKADDPGPEGRP
jgi:diguanylate cyclase (GGDEF)-like protein